MGLVARVTNVFYSGAIAAIAGLYRLLHGNRLSLANHQGTDHWARAFRRSA
jgi:hypothetical protein